VGAVLVLTAVALIGAEAVTTRETLRNWRDSLSLWGHIVRVAPRVAESHNGLGVVHAGLHQTDAAIAEYRRAVALDPSCWSAHLNLGTILLQRGDLSGAEHHLGIARFGLPGDPDAAFHHGMALLAAGKLAEAEAEMRNAVSRRPGNWQAMSRLGTIMALRGRVDHGIAMVENAIRIAPGEASPRFWLAMILLEAGGREPEAIARFEDAIRLDPKSPDAANQLAWVLATHPNPAVRDPVKARDYARRAVELAGGDDPRTLDTWAAAEAAAGRFDEARRTGKRALDAAARTGPDTLAAAIRGRLSLYERDRPYVEISGGQAP
jgi:Flp pilus assembly protein TadD